MEEYDNIPIFLLQHKWSSDVESNCDSDLNNNFAKLNLHKSGMNI